MTERQIGGPAAQGNGISVKGLNNDKTRAVNQEDNQARLCKKNEPAFLKREGCLFLKARTI